MLLVAQRMYPLLGEDPSAGTLARRAIDKCWEWIGGRKIRAATLYKECEAVALRSREPMSPAVLKAFNPVASAISYVTWQAFKSEAREGVKQEVPAPMDDVEESVIEKTLDNAVKAGGLKDADCGSLAQVIAPLFQGSPHELGTPPMPRV